MQNKCLRLFKQIPLTLRYGLLLALGLIVLKTIEYQLFSFRFSLSLYTGLIAAFFMLIGISVSIGWLQFRSKKLNEEQVTEPLTSKEKKLLVGLNDGLSNQQLADAHFLSINTIKTHLKSIYKKLNVSTRTQAVEQAKRMKLL